MLRGASILYFCSDVSSIRDRLVSENYGVERTNQHVWGK